MRREAPTPETAGTGGDRSATGTDGAPRLGGAPGFASSSGCTVRSDPAGGLRSTCRLPCRPRPLPWRVPPLLLAALAVLTATSDAAPQDPPRRDAGPGIARSPEFLAKVDAAIDRGVAWLRATQAADGSFAEYPTFPGATTALAYHTLRVCGVPAADPSATKAWAAARRLAATGPLQTYSATCHLLATASHGNAVTSADDRDVKLSADDRRWAGELAKWLVSRQDTQGRWSYGGGYGPEPPGTFDHSNTQFALLGLKSAARCGVPLPATVWQRSLTHLLGAQEKDGREVPRRPEGAHSARAGHTWAWIVDHARGWGYHGSDATDRRGAYAAMTAGGVASLVLCRSELTGRDAMTAVQDFASDRAVRDGLAWLGSRWRPDPYAELPDTTANPLRRSYSGAEMYEFYAVERAGVLAGTEWMADLDWYGAGARFLVGAQQADGSWNGKTTGLQGTDHDAAASALRPVDTCFALLFLKRGTATVRRGALTASTGDGDVSFAAGAKLTGRDLDDFVDLVVARWTRVEGEFPRSTLMDGAATLGPKVVEPLLARLVSDDAGVRTAAHAILRHVTGEDHGFVATDAAPRREEAIVRWRGWWLVVKDRLRYDPERKRLVSGGK